VFRSFATDLVAATDTNSALDIFVRDLTIGRTTLVSINRFGTSSGNSRSGTAGQVAAISQDGHFLAFSSSSSDLVENDGNATEDVFVRPVP
jgi:hypothetical protein